MDYYDYETPRKSRPKKRVGDEGTIAYYLSDGTPEEVIGRLNSLSDEDLIFLLGKARITFRLIIRSLLRHRGIYPDSLTI
ncbi:MAG: hypothetical protein NZ992_00675 [Candidatus Korarchaeum sp.]|nr:hypothetical protein [Candidatus Korarchaeum sp.]